MRGSAQSPYGGGVQHVVGGDGAVETGRMAEVRGRNPARRRVVMVAAGHEQIRRRQHRQRDARVAHQRHGLVQRLGRQHRQLGDMADGDAALHAVGDGLARHLFEMPPARVEVEIEVEVEIHAEVLRHGEDPRDMPLGVGAGAGAAAEQVGACRKLFGAGAVEQPPPAETRRSAGRAPRHSRSAAAAPPRSPRAPPPCRSRHGCGSASCPRRWPSRARGHRGRRRPRW